MTPDRFKSIAKFLGAIFLCQLLILSTPVAYASFLDDFYNAAGGQVNVTPAQIRKIGSGGYVTGGSVVWRVPAKTFTPYRWSPPGMKAGCGGIDLWMGSFGFADASEFVEYLRQVGQNAIGVFFKMALQSMSPDLNAVIESLAKDNNMMNVFNKTSCQAAQSLLTGAGITSQSMQEWRTNATAFFRGEGIVSDAVVGEKRVGSDMSQAITGNDLGAKPNSGGKTQGKAEQNFLWTAMNTGTITDFDDSLKEMAMSMLGVEVIRRNGQTAEVNVTAPTLSMDDFVGSYDTPSVSLKVVTCDEPEACLNPSIVSKSFPTLANKVYVALKGVSDKVVARQALDDSPTSTDAFALRVMNLSSLPVYKVIELTSQSNAAFLADQYITRFSEVIAYELAIAFVQKFTEEVRRSITKAQKDSSPESVQNSLKDYQSRLLSLRRNAEDVKKRIDASTGGVAGNIQMMEHLQRVMYQRMSTASITAARGFNR